VAVCFFLSLGSKSTAVSFPLACILFYYWKGKRCARRTWGHLSVLLLIFFVSIILLISNSQVVQTTVLNGYSYFMTQIAVFVRYLWLIVFPFDIVPEYIVPIKTSLDFGLMIYLFFHLSVIVWSLKMVKEKRALGLGFLLGYITLLPSSSFMPRDNVMLVYRLYLPLIGVAVFLCACLDSIPRQKKYIRIGARIMFVLYLIVCLSQCIYQNVLLSDNVAMWQNIKERFPQSYIPDFNIGSVYLREGNVDGALTSFGESLNKGANDPKVFYNFATALQLKGKLKESLMYYRRAHTRAPYEKKYWIGLGNAYYLDNQFVQALYFYKLYIESYPLAADVYNNVFYCYSAMGDDRAALGAIAHAISVEEKRFYLMNQALCLSRLSEYENALAVLNHVQSVHGLSIDILFQKGVIAQTQQKYDQALMLYSDVLLRDAEHIGALNNSGVLLYQGGRFDEARQKWSTVLSIAPQDKVAIMNMKRLKNENVDR